MGYKRRKGYGWEKNTNKSDSGSLFRVVGIFVLVLGVGWLLLQLFGSGEKATLQVEQPPLRDSLFLDRKNIYDRSLQPLAVSFCQYAVYVKPLEVEVKADTARILAQLLGLDEKGLFRRLSTERTFIWLVSIPCRHRIFR